MESVEEFKENKAFVENIFNNWIEKSIEKVYEVLKDDNSGKTTPLMAFVLVSCAIDFIAGFYKGRNTKYGHGIGNQYKKFVEDFLKDYNSKILYEDLRCAIAHNFSLGQSIVLTHNNPPYHLKKDKQRRTLINFENFFEDYKKGVRYYFEKLENDTKLQKLFLKRLKNGGIANAKEVKSQDWS